jgi:hypothetical protein
MMNWERCGRKLSWSDMWYYPSMGGPEENIEELMSGLRFELDILQIQGRSVTA